MMTKTRWIPVLLFMLAIARPAFGQEPEAYKRHPGYIDLSFVKELGEPSQEVEIFLTPGLVKLLSSFDEDEELGAVLKKLVMIKAYTFEIGPKNRKKFLNRIEETRKKLRAGNWLKFINVREKNETTEVYMKETNDEIQGLTVLSVEPNEVSFVNIVGIIDLESLGKLGRKWNIPRLDSLQFEQKRKPKSEKKQ